ncbi:MAG: Hpt domain-containing protein [Nautiliaceae bacterium]
MFIILRNSKIEAIDKKLASLLKTDLYTISEVINIIDLQIKSLKEETLKINNYLFTVKEETVLSTQDIKIFSLSLKKQHKTATTTEKISSLEISKAQTTLEEELIQAATELGVDLETIKELKKELFNMFKTEKENLKKALETQDYETLHKTAHKLKGAALNLRLHNIGKFLKEIDESSRKKEDIKKLSSLIENFYKYIHKLEAENKNKINIPSHIAKLIKETLKEYKSSKNLKKFNKDKKYIEKILNTKIASPQELEELIKENK